jgi:tRNA-dihydrouridine synthase
MQEKTQEKLTTRNKLPKPFFAIAPMDDVTDTVFRQIVADCAPPDIFFTEFVNVDGLQSPGRQALLKKLQFTPREKPLIAQIWGKHPENYRKTAKELVKMGFAGIDINMGCPIKNIVNNGCCCALINNRPLAVDIIKATQAGAGGKIPVSVKTRLGFNEIDLSWHELLLNQGLDCLTVHGRTRRELSNSLVNWEAIEQIRQARDKLSSQTLIVGNGDIATRQQGLQLAKQHSLDGVMIGRGVLADPFVFAESSPWANYSRDQKLALFKNHIELFVSTWGEDRPTNQLNKFCKIYVNGFDGAKELREKMMAAKSSGNLLEMAETSLVAR